MVKIGVNSCMVNLETALKINHIKTTIAPKNTNKIRIAKI